MQKSIKIQQNLIFSTTTFILSLIFLSTIVYKLYALNNLGIILSLFSAFLFTTLAQKKLRKNSEHFILKIKRPTNKNILFFLLYISFFLISVYLLVVNRTSQSIISPWEFLPNYFFIIYFLLSATLFLNILKNKTSISLFLISLHYLFSFSIALIVYKIAYGYDIFIHEATLNIIKEKGFINPKPFYYLGQYSLIILLNKLLFIPISLSSKLLVPIIASFGLPALLYRLLNTWFENKKNNLLVILLLLIFTFPFFIISTPQNFSYLLLIIVIILGLNFKKLETLLTMVLLSSIALTTQAIAGIPAFFFIFILLVFKSNFKFKKIILLLVFILSTISLPLAFSSLSNSVLGNSGEKINIGKALLHPVTNSYTSEIIPFTEKSENIFLNLIYLYGFNIKIIILFIFLFGLLLSVKYKKITKIFKENLFMFFSLVFSYLLLSQIDFSYLIEYERSDYTNRILLTASFFLLPFLLVFFSSILNRLKNEGLFVKASLSFFALLLITASLYLSYPRHDAYFNSRGYSTGNYDMKAVEIIEENTNNNYIVLANQQVSVAALKQYGFNNYFNNIFYYPIPTGGPLYQYYLDMVYKKPSKETMNKAMELTGVYESYFVLNKYWWAFTKIRDEAKMEADSYTSLGNDEVFIFKYTR